MSGRHTFVCRRSELKHEHSGTRALPRDKIYIRKHRNNDDDICIIIVGDRRICNVFYHQYERNTMMISDVDIFIYIYFDIARPAMKNVVFGPLMYMGTIGAMRVRHCFVRYNISSNVVDLQALSQEENVRWRILYSCVMKLEHWIRSIDYIRTLYNSLSSVVGMSITGAQFLSVLWRTTRSIAQVAFPGVYG
jgi:hypothetical protein